MYVCVESNMEDRIPTYKLASLVITLPTPSQNVIFENQGTYLSRGSVVVVVAVVVVVVLT